MTDIINDSYVAYGINIWILLKVSLQLSSLEG